MQNTACDFAAEFAAQKPLPKKEIYKLKPGTWIELRWKDAPNNIVLLAERVVPGKGDISIRYFDVADGKVTWKQNHWRGVHDQIVAIHGCVELIAPIPNRK